MRKKRLLSKSASALLTAACVISQCLVPAAAADSDAYTQKISGQNPADSDSDFYYTDYYKYDEYLEGLSDGINAQSGITVGATAYDASASKKAETGELDGSAAVLVAEDGEIVLPVTVEQSGFYNITLDYYPVSAGSSSVKFELLIDGSLPFREASSISLKRVWGDSTEPGYDSQGNEIRLPSRETPVWVSKTLTDTVGFSQSPLKFYLTAGEHRISFSVYQNTLALGKLSLTPPQELKPYKDVLAAYESGSCGDAVQTRRIEAENATAKSDRSIVKINDKTSPVTMPYSGSKLVYNAIGAGSWKTAGEWIEWEIDVPEDGLYTLVLRFKQDTKSGDVSFRTLYIDGEIPFHEASSLAFRYSGGWQTRALGDENGDYKFYLTAGRHTLRLEATLGDYGSMISRVSSALTALNGVYTDIVMVTGPQPDVDRDYQFEKVIPDVLNYMPELSDELKQIESGLEQLTGETGGQSTAVIRRLYIQLDKMIKEPETISKRLKNFINDITSLGTWINTSREQPLQLDYIMLSNEAAGVPKDRSGIFSLIKYHVGQFLYSFVMDYANVGNRTTGAETEIRVWIGSGRDQADIIRQLVNESFTPEYDIGANVQLVNAGALLPATLAGVGPDVYLGIAEDQPVDYALRHAVVNLSRFDDIDEVLTRFYPNSLTSFYLDSNLYALPETMSYPMLFYRKDILTQLGIKETDLSTWDSLLQKVLPELDMNYFDFGIPTTIKTYANFLYQSGGSFYNETNTASDMNSAAAVSAFQKMTTMFTDYSTPVAYDFANRFRSGQMPLAVAEYTSYNQLSVFAPEIAGLWGMLPIPGIEDGNSGINNTAMCTVTGAVILSNSSYTEQSWSFLKWWTSTPVQSRYAGELETVMGTGARYAAANIEAMQTVEWDRGIKDALSRQLRRSSACHA